MSAALAHAPRGFVQRSEYDRLQRELDEARERLAYFESERRFEEDAAATGPAAWKLRPGLAHIVRHLGSRALVTRALLIDNWPGGREPSQQSLDVYMREIRDRLGPFGIRIETVQAMGWKLDPDTRAFVRRAMTGEVESVSFGPPVDRPGLPRRRSDAALARDMLERLDQRALMTSDLRRALATSEKFFAPVRDRLEAEGLIEIRRSRRCLFHTITEAGRARLANLREQDAPAADTEARNGSSH